MVVHLRPGELDLQSALIVSPESVRMPGVGRARIARSAFAPLVLRHARRRGLDVDALLDAYRLSPSIEREPIAGLPTDTVRALAEEVSERLGEPDLGVHLAIELERGSYGVLEFAVRSASSLREALDRFARYQRMLNDLVEITLLAENGWTTIIERFPGQPEGGGKHGNEFALAAILAIARQISGRQVKPRRAWLAHVAPAAASSGGLFGRFLGTDRIEHGAGYNALEMADEDLDLPVISADPSLLSVMDRVAPLLAPPRADVRDAATIARARDAIADSLHEGPPSLVDLAKRISSSARSLQRELQAHGTSFRNLVAETRRELVTRQLAETELSLEAIATRAGYSDVRALARAFQRWTGMSPAQWRRRKRGP